MGSDAVAADGGKLLYHGDAGPRAGATPNCAAGGLGLKLFGEEERLTGHDVTDDVAGEAEVTLGLVGGETRQRQAMGHSATSAIKKARSAKTKAAAATASCPASPPGMKPTAGSGEE